jgi:hypothetical protein
MSKFFYRPLSWHDISASPAKIVGWGIEVKPPGQRRYKPCLHNREVHPFADKSAAKEACDQLNKEQPILKIGRVGDVGQVFAASGETTC